MCIHRLYIFTECGHFTFVPEPLSLCDSAASKLSTIQRQSEKDSYTSHVAPPIRPAPPPRKPSSNPVATRRALASTSPKRHRFQPSIPSTPLSPRPPPPKHQHPMLSSPHANNSHTGPNKTTRLSILGPRPPPGLSTCTHTSTHPYTSQLIPYLCATCRVQENIMLRFRERIEEARRDRVNRVVGSPRAASSQGERTPPMMSPRMPRSFEREPLVQRPVTVRESDRRRNTGAVHSAQRSTAVMANPQQQQKHNDAANTAAHESQYIFHPRFTASGAGADLGIASISRSVRSTGASTMAPTTTSTSAGPATTTSSSRTKKKPQHINVTAAAPTLEDPTAPPDQLPEIPVTPVQIPEWKWKISLAADAPRARGRVSSGGGGSRSGVGPSIVGGSSASGPQWRQESNKGTNVSRRESLDAFARAAATQNRSRRPTTGLEEPEGLGVEMAPGVVKAAVFATATSAKDGRGVGSGIGSGGGMGDGISDGGSGEEGEESDGDNNGGVGQEQENEKQRDGALVGWGRRWFLGRKDGKWIVGRDKTTC
ncbi:MAG: hypothetical protein M1831_007557 [Alyxoria varia]|nr:MAG: hypothetical protein M1831_007557 [Alyxoria varia]